jgi:hypothetical protein
MSNCELVFMCLHYPNGDVVNCPHRSKISPGCLYLGVSSDVDAFCRNEEAQREAMEAHKLHFCVCDDGD